MLNSRALRWPCPRQDGGDGRARTPSEQAGLWRDGLSPLAETQAVSGRGEQPSLPLAAPFRTLPCGAAPAVAFPGDGAAADGEGLCAAGGGAAASTAVPAPPKAGPAGEQGASLRRAGLPRFSTAVSRAVLLDGPRAAGGCRGGSGRRGEERAERSVLQVGSAWGAQSSRELVVVFLPPRSLMLFAFYFPSSGNYLG